MNDISFENHYDFRCWVVKYDLKPHFPVMVGDRNYSRGCLYSDSYLVPLIWGNNPSPETLIGCANLIYKDEGVYAYCKLFSDIENIDVVKTLLNIQGSISLAPYVEKVKWCENNEVKSGKITSVSLIFDRADRHEEYFPIIGGKMNGISKNKTR